MNKLTEFDLDHAEILLKAEGPASMYKYLISKGDRYSALAIGVVERESLSGIAASAYLDLTAEKYGKELSIADKETIMRSMAGYFLKDRRSNTELFSTLSRVFPAMPLKMSGAAWCIAPG
ncbi:hypothetical protein [Pseudomonas putida]|uniref:hypothetical protein n=1 Tax=Pseudomonas putida TaxID=303 RepID=UPI000950F34A|nr:hypothetical protein [Pseudomonas putida]